MKVVNLYGGPGTGKSICAASVFAELKRQGYNCELVTEYAKDKYWDDHIAIFENQLYIFAKQLQRIKRLVDKVDYVITDSPLLLQKYYYMDRMPVWGATGDTAYLTLVDEIYRQFDNIDVFLLRNPKFQYQSVGKYQTEIEAHEIDKKLRTILDDVKSVYHVVQTGENDIDLIMKIILAKEPEEVDHFWPI